MRISVLAPSSYAIPSSTLDWPAEPVVEKVLPFHTAVLVILGLSLGLWFGIWKVSVWAIQLGLTLLG